MNPETRKSAPRPINQRRRHATRATSRLGVRYDKARKLLVFAGAADDTNVARARMTLHGQHDDASREAMASAKDSLPVESVRKMAEYMPELPKQHVDTIRAFVEDAVALTLPKSSYTVETLMRPAMHFVHWAAFVVGVELLASVVFNRDLIEYYVREQLPDLTDGTRRNYRAWLFRVAEAVNPEANPRNPMPLNGREMEAPYTANEIDALKRWASGQGTPYSRAAATILLALGLGAGLSAGEISTLRRKDVQLTDGVLAITVGDGSTHRTVPVMADFERSLSRLLGSVAEDALVFLPRRHREDNDIVGRFIERTSTPPGTPAVRARRLRNTWLVRQMTNRVDVFTLMNAAGLQSLESISRLARFVPHPTDQERIAQLRGTR